MRAKQTPGASGGRRTCTRSGGATDTRGQRAASFPGSSPEHAGRAASTRREESSACRCAKNALGIHPRSGTWCPWPASETSGNQDWHPRTEGAEGCWCSITHCLHKFSLMPLLTIFFPHLVSISRAAWPQILSSLQFHRLLRPLFLQMLETRSNQFCTRILVV